MFKTLSQLGSAGFALVAASIAIMALDSSPSFAESDEEKGRGIASEADRRDYGWRSSETALKMILRNRHGQTSTRELTVRALETNDPGLGDRSLIVFSSPRDVDGTAFLSHTKIVEPDDQWLYLPALKRVKRISSSNKSGPFLGSEFSFEDLTSQEVDKYNYKWLRDEPLGGMPCFVVERYPLYENSGYTRHIVWTDQAEYRPMKVEFYDRKSALLKTLVFEDYHQYEQKYWRALTMTMTNHQSGKSTILRFEDYTLSLDIDESTFTPGRLRMAR